MRIIRFIAPNGRVLIGEDLQDNTAVILTGSIADGIVRSSQRIPVKKLLTPIVPSDIICIGTNYAVDAGTLNLSDRTLEVFVKPSTSLQHPNDPIFVPHFNDLDPRLDCEGELAVIIGRETRNIEESDAMKHVFGYTIANDVTARAFQTPTGPPRWMRGKGFDTFCPLGPAIVTADEVVHPDSLAIRTIIDGITVREGSTKQMNRTITQIIAALSRHMTLRAGAVILTGAPPTNGGTPYQLSPGSRIEVQIEAIGSLVNVIGLHDASRMK